MNRELWSFGTFIVTSCLTLLLFGSGNSQILAQRTDGSQKEDRNPKLTYKVSPLPDSAKVQRGDAAVWLEAELKNDGTQPIDVFWDDYGTSSSFQFSIVHELTGRPLSLSTNDLPRLPRPEAARITQFRSIASGYSLKSRLSIGELQSLTAFFREPGRYIVNPSLVVSTNRVFDDKTGVESMMKTAWTGTIHAEPFAIELPASVDRASGDGVIAGTVVSADGQPVEGAIVKLAFATRGASFEEDRELDSMMKRVLDQTSSTKGGHFDFVRLPNDADFLLVANHPSHGRQSLHFTFKEFMRREQPNIKFPKRITIRGKVVDSKGLPVSDVGVCEYGTEASSSRDDGTFQCLAIEKEDGKPYRIDLWKKEWSSTSAVANLQLATSGEWTIAMQSETEMTIRGRAVFVDDMPLSKMAIQVDLVPIPSQVGDIQAQIVSHPFRIQTETDLEGNFSFAMPSKGDFSGKIVATARKSQESRERRWSIEVPKLSFGQEPLELKFDNRGQIDFAVFGSSNLPDSLQPTIALSSTRHNYNLEWERISVSSLGKVRYYDGLEPGEYEFKVDWGKSGIKSQAVKVLVPDREPHHGLGKIQLPKTVFGSVLGKLLMPDNQTPASNLGLDVYGENDYHNSLKTDDTGAFQLKFLPIGEYAITVKNGRGISPNSILFSITDHNSVDMGVVRLKAEAEEFGWFDGKIAYESGGSVGGVFVMNKLENDFTATSFSSGDISNPDLKASGDFHLRLPEGNKNLIFYLHGNGPSPISMGSSFSVGREIKHKLIVDVDILAGSTTERDFHIPLRQNCRDVTVGWVGMNEPHFSIISTWNDSTRWIYSTRNNTRKLDSAGNRIKQGDFTITGFPTSDAYVLVSSWEYADRLFAIKSIPATNDDSTVIFNQEDLSTIQIGLVDAKDAQIKEFSVFVFALMNDEKILVTKLNVPSQSIPVNGYVPWAKRLADGQVTIPNLGSGKYFVTISNAYWSEPVTWQRKSLVAAKDAKKAFWEHSHEIDLGKTTNLHLQFQIDTEGELVDTKVTTQVRKE